MTANPSIQVKLPADLDIEKLPRHVAVIMDGNGRWAQTQGLPRFMGHRRGVDALKDLLKCCKDWGIPSLTAYAFSTENWHRPMPEVEFLMTLFERVLRRELEEMRDEGVQIRFVGDLDALPDSLRTEIDRAMEATQDNTKIKFNVATNYGGRREILHACRSIAKAVQDNHLDPSDIDESVFEKFLYTAGLGDPDLLIRTSGEMRVSNFLLWQMAYSELYVTETFWPDFDRQAFYQALQSFQSRKRRFGKV